MAHRLTPRFLIALPVLLLLAAAFHSLGTPQNPSRPRVYLHDQDAEALSLADRKNAQLATVDEFKVFYQFHFTDQLEQSGITFRQHIVEDSGAHYNADHYDHGSGIAVADVDGDGLYDIYFVNQYGGNELWKNLGGGKFKNITAEAGVGVPGRISSGASFADIDNDGAPDLFVTTIRGGDVLFKNDGHGHFTDISKEAGVDLITESTSATFFDYNNDGLIDLLVCNVGHFTTNQGWPDGSYAGLQNAFLGHLYPERYEYPVLYQNLGQDRFKNVTEDVGLHPRGFGGDASFVDLNADGWPDILFLNMQGHSHYDENQAGKQFIDKTEQYFPKTPWGAMGIKFFDYDNDGRMDLIITDMHTDMMHNFTPAEEKQKLPEKNIPVERLLGGSKDDFIFGNAFFHNLGYGKFEEISDRIGAENFWPWGVSVGDVNADGWDDIFIASGMGEEFRYGINSLLLNNRGEKFLDSEFLLGIEPRRDGHMYTPWFDIDCSQTPPKLLENMGVCKGQTGPVTVMSPLSSRSSVVFDLDNDGDLDIVTNNFNSEPQVFVSDLAQQKQIHWLKIVLVGTASNREGLGATVRVHAGGQTYTKYNDGKSGHLSQSDLPLYFGLGDAPGADRIEVKWPSGRKQVLNAAAGNQTLVVTEPK